MMAERQSRSTYGSVILAGGLLLVFLLLGGCELLDSESAGPPDTFDEAREQWGARGFDDYTFRLERSCFCGPSRLEATVHVRQDTVYRLTDVVGDGEPFDTTAHPMALKSFRSVEELFELVGAAERGEIDHVEATYDSTLGYPLELSVDYQRSVADEEVYYRAWDVRSG